MSALYAISQDAYNALDAPVLYMYSYTIDNPEQYAASEQKLAAVPGVEGVLAAGTSNGELDWIKTLFAFSLFIFLVLSLCAAAMLCMKLSSDAQADREDHVILIQTGYPASRLRQAARAEIAAPYWLTLFVCAGGGWFAWKTISSVIDSVSIVVYGIAMGVIALILLLFYLLSVRAYIEASDIGVRQG